MKIDQPGVYAGIPEPVYHGDPYVEPSISSTGVRQLLKCPALFWAHSPRNPDRVPTEASAAMNFGSAAHKWLLEPEWFDRSIWVKPNGFSEHHHKKWADVMPAFDAAVKANKRVISEKDKLTIEAMKATLEADPLIRQLLTNCDVEQSAFWVEQTEEGPVVSRKRTDGRPRSGQFILDYKTCECASPDAVKRAILNYGLHIQGAHYMAGEVALGGNPQKFFLLFQEKKPPYLAVIYEIDEVTLSIGEQRRMEALATFAKCSREGRWPSYGNGHVLTASLPNWMIKQETFELGAAA